LGITSNQEWFQVLAEVFVELKQPSAFSGGFQTSDVLGFECGDSHKILLLGLL
jgi:hypothetical protein